jgi:serine protease Do
MLRFAALSFITVALLPGRTPAVDPLSEVHEKVNQRMVKVFGAGGFARVSSYGTGILISPDGHILTSASPLLDTSDLVVHLYDGRRLKAVSLVVEPELDAALIQIRVEGKKPGEPTGLDLPYFDFAEAVKRPMAKPGDWVMAFSNAFEAANRDEPITMQRGVVAAVAKLHGRRGVFDFPYTGDVYVLDSVTNNPGAAGGALTDRQGNLLGIIGRDIHNTLSETMINYAIPANGKVEVKERVSVDGKEEEQTVVRSLPEFIDKGMKGQYKPVKRPDKFKGEGGYTGIVFVPNILERTPAYVEDVIPGSPAAKAGLKPDDLISFVDGDPIVSIKAFETYRKTHTRPGSVVRLEVRRGDQLQTVELTLGTHPARPTVTPPPPEKKP